MKRILGMVLGVAGFAMLSQAALIPTLQAPPSPFPVGPNWGYLYTVSLAADEQIGVPGNPDSVVIYDFAGFTGTVLFGVGGGVWNFATAPGGLGPTPAGTP